MENDHHTSEMFSARFEGGDADQHEIDARDSSMFVSGLSTLLERVAKKTVKSDIEISLKIKTEPRQGSWEVLFELVSVGVIALNTSEVSAFMNLIGLVGLTRSAQLSLLALVKQLRGEDIRTTTPTEGDTQTVIVETNNGIIAENVNINVRNLYVDSGIRNAIGDMIAPLTEGRGHLQAVSFGGNNIQNEQRERITRIDAACLKPRARFSSYDSISEEYISFCNTSLEGNGRGWRLRYIAEESREFPADIRDKEFLEKVANEELIIRKNDVAKIALHRSRPETKMRKGQLKYEVLEVLDFFPREDYWEGIPDDEIETA